MNNLPFKKLGIYFLFLLPIIMSYFLSLSILNTLEYKNFLKPIEDVFSQIPFDDLKIKLEKANFIQTTHPEIFYFEDSLNNQDAKYFVFLNGGLSIQIITDNNLTITNVNIARIEYK